MGKWSQYDTDAERLPAGMRRIGYDADTQTYTYGDADGSVWQGAPGARYGTVRQAAGQDHVHSVPARRREERERARTELSDDVYEFLMLSDRRQPQEKKPRSRYKPRPGSETERPPQRRKSTIGGFLQLYVASYSS